MNITTFMLATAALGGSLAAATPARAGSEPYLGEIMMTGSNYCPRGWAATDGQLLSISDNTALFSLLGTTYGGDGVRTFALPDLRGRAPVHVGRGPGLLDVVLGERNASQPLASGGTDPKATRSQPILAIRYCIARQGIFPPRS